MADRGAVGSKRVHTILWKVHAALLIVQLGYSSSYVVSKIALTTGVNPIVFAVYRDAVCLLALIPVAWFIEKGRRAPLTIQVLVLLVSLGFFGAYITQLLVLYGLSLTSAAYTSTVSVLTPMFTFIISASFGFEKIQWRKRDGQAKVVGLIIAVVGAVVLATFMGPVVLGPVDIGLHSVPLSAVDTSGLLGRTLVHLKLGPWHLGILCLFLAGFTLSISISIQVPLLARYPAPISASAFAYFFGAIMLYTTALLTTQDQSVWVLHQMSAVVSVIYNGLIPAALNYTLLIWCVFKTGPVLVASYVPLQLFFAAALAYLCLDESIHLGCLLGTILIVTGLGLITWAQVEAPHVDSLPVTAAPSLNKIPSSTSILAEPLLGQTLHSAGNPTKPTLEEHSTRRTIKGCRHQAGN